MKLHRPLNRTNICLHWFNKNNFCPIHYHPPSINGVIIAGAYHPYYVFSIREVGVVIYTDHLCFVTTTNSDSSHSA